MSLINSNKKRVVKEQKTLLIDGESLLKQGFYGTKDTVTKNGRIATVYNFYNQIRKIYETDLFNKVVVFWEGEDSKKYRQNYYSKYKSDRVTSELDQYLETDLMNKRLLVKNCNEDLFIRQVEVYGCEADDAIALYCKMAPNEIKTICTNDMDLTQLIDVNTKVYLWGKKILVNFINFKSYFKYHHENVGLIKILAGDKSDNIAGLQNIGPDTVLKLFPEIIDNPITLDWVRERAKQLLDENPKSNKIRTIVEGTAKWGPTGDDYYHVMKTIIDLREPYSPEELITEINEAINGVLNPEGRSGVEGVISTFATYGIGVLFSRKDEYFLEFWNPFLNIVNTEKRKYNSYLAKTNL